MATSKKKLRASNAQELATPTDGIKIEFSVDLNDKSLML